MRIGRGLLASLLLVLAPAAGAKDAPARVQLRQGLLEGITAGGVTSYRAIPYARPPVG